MAVAEAKARKARKKRVILTIWKVNLGRLEKTRIHHRIGMSPENSPQRLYLLQLQEWWGRIPQEPRCQKALGLQDPRALFFFFAKFGSPCPSSLPTYGQK